MPQPRKKIILALCIALVIALGAYYYKQPPKLVRNNSDTLADEISRSEVLATDTDGDGLKDWEEDLWKTDKTLLDTDGDGTSDADEVKAGRNPAVAGPNDQFDTETIETKINQVTEGDLSDSEKFSRELFAKYIGAKQNSTDPRFEELLNSSLEKSIATAPISLYRKSDLTIVVSTQSAVLKTYGNAMGNIFVAKSPTGLEHELVILDRAVRDDNPDELIGLDGNIAAYKKIEEQLLEVEVPEALINTHLSLLNSVHIIIGNLEGMKLIFSDPVRATGMVGNYPEAAEMFVTSLKNITAYLRDQRVSFRQSEDGYSFVRSI